MRIWIVTACLFATAAYAASSQFTMREEGVKRVITSNAIPNHTPGQFPNRGNPNSISPQSFRFEMPLHPKRTGETTQLGRDLFGVALNGVPFEPGTAETWKNRRNTAWRIEGIHPTQGGTLGMDAHNAHVQPTGMYHYHGMPTGLVESQADKGSALIGYAADGFPIYVAGADDTSSYRLKSGTRPGGDDAPSGRYDGTYTIDYEYHQGIGSLDDCNGKYGRTKEYPDGTYYYVLTQNFPYVPRCFKGTPDQSFAKRRTESGHNGMRHPPRHRHPPHHRPHRF